MHQTAILSAQNSAPSITPPCIQTAPPTGYRGLTVWSPNIQYFFAIPVGAGAGNYGEDPYLTSRMGVAFITGLQGNDPKYFKTVATSKTLRCSQRPESTRHTSNIEPSRHDVEDTYLPAFRFDDHRR